MTKSQLRLKQISLPTARLTSFPKITIDLFTVYDRLDFRRLPGPVFDPPRKETAGRVTR